MKKSLTTTEAELISIGIQYAVEYLDQSDKVAEEISEDFIFENEIEEVTNSGIQIFGNKFDILFLFAGSALILICTGMILGRVI